MKVMALDVGVTTGVAILNDEFQVKHVAAVDCRVLDTAREQIARAIQMYTPRRVIVEMPIFDITNPNYHILMATSAMVRVLISVEGFGKTIIQKVDFIRPTDWKSTPAMRWSPGEIPGKPHKLTTHEMDAMRMCFWYLRWRVPTESPVQKVTES